MQQVKNGFLRVCQYVLQGLLSGVTGIGNLLRGFNQPSQHCLLPDNGGIGPYIGRRRHHGHDIPYKIQAANLRRHILFLQTVLEGYQVHGLAFIEQLYHGVKHDSVLLLVKITSRHNLRCGNHCLPVHEHGTDD